MGLLRLLLWCVGLVWVGVAVWLLVKGIRMLAGGYGRARATATGATARRRMDKYGEAECPVVRFQLPDGQHVESVLRKDGAYKAGWLVGIRYDKMNPSADVVAAGWFVAKALGVLLASIMTGALAVGTFHFAGWLDKQL